MRGRTTLAAILALAALFSFRPSMAEGRVLIAEDPVGDAAVDPSLGAIGLDVTGLYIEHVAAPTPHLEFTVKVTNLPAAPPNEVVRYLWQVTVAGKEYWLQAKRSDFSTATATADDPSGTASHLDGAFRLRGNCGVTVALSTCKHLLWLDGAFDTEAGEIRMSVPLGNPIAPHFASGALINQTGTNVMTASIQVAISNAQTSDTVTGYEAYIIP